MAPCLSSCWSWICNQIGRKQFKRVVILECICIFSLFHLFLPRRKALVCNLQNKKTTTKQYYAIFSHLWRDSTFCSWMTRASSRSTRHCSWCNPKQYWNKTWITCLWIGIMSWHAERSRLVPFRVLSHHLPCATGQVGWRAANFFRRPIFHIRVGCGGTMQF